MKGIVPLLAGLFLLVGFFVTPASAEVPALPHAFYGGVEINTSPAPIGTEVEARGIGVKRPIEGNPISVTEAGKYGGPGGLDPKLVVQGDIEEGTTIEFYVKEVSTGQTAEWHSGEVTELPLSVSIAVPSAGVGGGVSDTTAPTFSAISISKITETTADISWKTNEASTSQVEYWSSPGKLSPLDKEKVINHLVHLTGLAPGTTYHYKTMSRDAAGNLAVSDEYTFTTLEAPAAAFASSDLSISPSEANIGETVTISVTVTNTGNASGSYKVTLKINGVKEADKSVTVAAGGKQTVAFSVTRKEAGDYAVAVDGLSGSFSVLAPPAPPAPPVPAPPVPAPAPAPAPTPTPIPPPAEFDWLPIIYGIIATLVVALIIFFLVRRRRTY